MQFGDFNFALKGNSLIGVTPLTHLIGKVWSHVRRETKEIVYYYLLLDIMKERNKTAPMRMCHFLWVRMTLKELASLRAVSTHTISALKFSIRLAIQASLSRGLKIRPGLGFTVMELECLHTVKQMTIGLG